MIKMLETAPSFSIYSNDTVDVVEGQKERENGLVDEDGNFMRSVTIGKKINRAIPGSGDFSFLKSSMDLTKEAGDEFGKVIVRLEKLGTEKMEASSPPMYLAAGPGLGTRDDLQFFGENTEISEGYCKELLEDYPNHPLVLRKYARLLQRKGDLEGAEKYYFRATQADPGYGEILSEYAQLIWEVHRDQERAFTYFELAAHTAPDDSNILAAYAKFLWEIDSDEEDNMVHRDLVQKDPQNSLHPANGVGNGGLAHGDSGPIFYTQVLNESIDIEKYYKRMIEENPSDPLLLKKYAQFLYQRKGDLQGAEEHYFHATQADPGDGEILSQYAQLVWELHHDQERALTYFQLAAHTAPDDSDIMATYAKFLWEIDSDEEDNTIHCDLVQEDPRSFMHTADEVEVGLGCLAHVDNGPVLDAEVLTESVDTEKYYKKMIEENSSDPLFLKKYAEFLYQSKEDLQGAEEYYSRAMLASPQDGEVLLQYATLVWELYHDLDITSNYLEQAVEALPGESNVLAAYARFLWAIGDDELEQK